MENEANAGGPAPETETTETPTTTVETETTERSQVPEEKFVETWVTVQHEMSVGKLQGNGKEIVAQRLGLKPASVDQRKNTINKRLREAKAGELPKMPRASGNRVDVSRTAALLQAAMAKVQPADEQKAE